MPYRLSYIFATAMLMLLSCSKTSLEQEGGVLPNTPQYEASTTPIGFALGGDWAPLTKSGEGEGEGQQQEEVADPSKTEFTDGDEFSVFGYYIPQGETLSTPNFMYNQSVAATDATPGDNTDNEIAWDYSPQKYWPNNTGDKLSFYAFYPSTASNPYSGIYVPQQEADSPLKLSYYATNRRTDILYAVSLDNEKPQNSDAVELDFKHLLGKIMFKISLNDNDPGELETILLKSIGYSIPQNCTVTLPATENGEPVWEVSQSTGYSIELSGMGMEINETPTVYQRLTAFHIPCEISSITLSVSTDGYTHQTITATPANPIQILSGQATVVNLVISTTEVSVTAETQPWKTVTIEQEFEQ